MFQKKAESKSKRRKTRIEKPLDENKTLFLTQIKDSPLLRTDSHPRRIGVFDDEEFDEEALDDEDVTQTVSVNEQNELNTRVERDFRHTSLSQKEARSQLK